MGLKKLEETISIIFRHLGKSFRVKGKKGDSVLEVAHRNNIPLEGACDGNLACSTCHVICDKSIYDDKYVSERENDLLDLAYGLTPTSRLACQVKLDNTMNDKIFEIPRATRNLAVDGFIPKPH